jgi:hypothetical protein
VERIETECKPKEHPGACSKATKKAETWQRSDHAEKREAAKG